MCYYETQLNHSQNSRSITLFTFTSFFGPNPNLQKAWPVKVLVEVKPLSPLRVGLTALTL